MQDEGATLVMSDLAAGEELRVASLHFAVVVVIAAARHRVLVVL